jgi:hypothetical protein
MHKKFQELEEKLNKKLDHMLIEKRSSFDAKEDSEFIRKNEQRDNISQLKVVNRDNQNNIKLEGSMLEFVDIKKSPEEPPYGSIFDDSCSICSNPIYFIKYSCCICRNTILCEICEKDHSHPCIKFKEKEVSTVEEVFTYLISQQQNRRGSELNKSFFKKVKEISENLFERKFKANIDVFSQKFAMRPNRTIKIPVLITNESKNTIPPNKILVMARNNKDLIVKTQICKYEIHPKQKVEVSLECTSSQQLKSYDFEILLYSNEVNIEAEVIPMKIEVNNDEDEEEIDSFFAMQPKILTLEKFQKEIIMHVIKSGTSVKHPYVIYNTLIKFNWDLDLAMNELVLKDQGLGYI